MAKNRAPYLSGALIYSYYCGYDDVFPSVAAPKADALPACATPPRLYKYSAKRHGIQMEKAAPGGAVAGRDGVFNFVRPLRSLDAEAAVFYLAIRHPQVVDVEVSPARGGRLYGTP
jgi:hypothetical protein